jgi:ATP-dependent DNA helicase RecG
VASLPRLSDLPRPPTLGALLALLGSVENDQLDFKREPARLKELIPAFAMTDGGLILIGINDDRTLHGCELTQKVADTITRAAKDVGVDVQLRQISVDSKPVIAVAVPEVRRRIVTTADGRLLRRVGSEIHPLVGDQLARFVREREEVPGEEEAVPRVSADDFDLTLMNHALTMDGRAPVSPVEYLRALVDLDVAVPQPAPADPKVTVAAIVLFAKDPRRFVSGASVQLVRRTGVGPGAGPTEAREELSGPVSTLVDACVAFISAHTKRYQVIIGTRRTVWLEYPEEVLREGLLNAFAHRDYGRQGTTVDVTIWDDRVEIRSPGGLPGPITLENIREEHYSRNRRVMRALKMLGLVEEYGEGIDRMYEFMDARLMEPPAIQPTPDSVTVTLRNRFLVSVEEQAWLSLLGHLNLTNHERRALAVARREGALTRRRILQLIPDANADALLRGAVAKGLLVRTGHAGGAKYELSEEVVMRAGASGVEAQSRKRQMLLDEVQGRGSLSTAEGAALLHEDQVLVRHLLNDLAAAGLVLARGQTRARRYYRA